MNYDIYFFSGHGEGDCGAVGNNTTEEIVSKRMTNKIVDLMNKKGLKVHTNNGKNNFNNCLLKGNTYNQKFGYTLHLNSSNNSDVNGIEIIVPCEENFFDFEINLLEDLKPYFNNRGIKSRDYDTGDFILRTDNKKYYLTDYYKEIREGWSLKVSSSIIELCFISSPKDMKILLENEDEICMIIANRILLSCGLKPYDNKPTINTSKDDDKWYRVISGSFRNKSYAEQRVKELKSKGFESFIEVRK